MHRAVLVAPGIRRRPVESGPFLSACIGVHPRLNFLPPLALFHPSGKEASTSRFFSGPLVGAIILGHRHSLAKKYLGKDVYPWHTARDVRVIYEIEPLSAPNMG